MATSSSTNYSLTARQIATAALELIGVCPIGETPAAEDAAKALEQLNLMVKTWGADPDPKLWQRTTGSVVLVASTASYSVTAARKVLSVRRRTSSLDTPLTQLSAQEYDDEPAKTATGVPRAWYFDPQRATRKIYIIGVPDATIAAAYTLEYTYLRVIEDLDTLDDDFDIPQEWLEVLEYGLAARLSMPYRTHISDAAGAQKIEARAASLYAQLASWDDEDASLFLQPAFQ